jgi:polyhydroxyalkanoate synthase
MTAMSHIAHKSAEPHGNGADPFNALDRSYHSVLAGLTQGISPVAGARAWFDWFAHLQMAPGKQAELMLQAWENATRLSQYAVQAAAVPDTEPGFRPSAGDRRFAGDGWKAWPYSLT